MSRATYVLCLALPACTAGALELTPGEPGEVPIDAATPIVRSSRGTARAGASTVAPTIPTVPSVPEFETDPPAPPAIVAMGLGRRHSCAVAKRGTLHCWGAGDRGQNGAANGQTIGDDEIPSTASDVDLGGRRVVDVAAGDHHTCALTDDGELFCFGVGGLGQLGSANTSDIGDDEAPGHVAPVDLGGRAVAVTAGEGHTCALLDGGAVVCFGAGDDGRLGYGNTEPVGDDEHPATVGRVDVGMDVVQIAAGAAHTCARSADGRVRCWGKNDGRLGYGFLEPIGDDEHPSDAGDVDLGGPATAIHAGTQHTCATLPRGEVTCFGIDAYGELGLGYGVTIGDDETPRAHRIDFHAPVTALSLGNFRTCARFDDGTIRCIGYPYDGGLGAATTAFAASPRSATPVGLGTAARAVVSGADHSCAIVEEGRVRCWGNGGHGRLGYGMTESVGDDEMPAEYGNVEL